MVKEHEEHKETKAEIKEREAEEKAAEEKAEENENVVSYMDRNGNLVKLHSSRDVLAVIANWPLGLRSDEGQAMQELARKAVVIATKLKE
jgi:hypothetical protein